MAAVMFLSCDGALSASWLFRVSARKSVDCEPCPDGQAALSWECIGISLEGNLGASCKGELLKVFPFGW